MELLKTGIKGFDEIAGGGLPKGHTILLAGPIGSYADEFALEYAYRGAEAGQKSIYVTFEKDEGDLVQAGEEFGWKIKEAVKAKNLLVIASELFNYEQLMATLEDEIFSYKADRVVVDSVTFLGGFFDSKFKYRKSIADMRRMLNKHGCTTLLVSETQGELLSPYGIEEFIADGVIHFHSIEKRGELMQAVSIPEIKGVQVKTCMYPVEETSKGLRIRDAPLML